MVLIAAISIIILLLIGALFMPIRLIVNTSKNQYLIKVPIYFSAQLVPKNQLFFIRLRLFLIPINIDPFKPRKKNPTNKNHEKRNLMPKALKTNFINMSNAFRIKKLHADIDTGNFPLNAQLIPLSLLSNNNNINLNINFENRNTADIEILTRLYKLFATLISNK